MDASAGAENIRPLQELSRADEPHFGGKSANLGELLAADIPVPPGFAISTDAFHVTNLSGDVNLVELSTTTSSADTLNYTIVGSNGSSVQLYVTVAATKNPNGADNHCYATGTVTPIPS